METVIALKGGKLEDSRGGLVCSTHTESTLSATPSHPWGLAVPHFLSFFRGVPTSWPGCQVQHSLCLLRAIHSANTRVLDPARGPWAGHQQGADTNRKGIPLQGGMCPRGTPPRYTQSQVLQTSCEVSHVAVSF